MLKMIEDLIPLVDISERYNADFKSSRKKILWKEGLSEDIASSFLRSMFTTKEYFRQKLDKCTYFHEYTQLFNQLTRFDNHLLEEQPQNFFASTASKGPKLIHGGPKKSRSVGLVCQKLNLEYISLDEVLLKETNIQILESDALFYELDSDHLNDNELYQVVRILPLQSLIAIHYTFRPNRSKKSRTVTEQQFFPELMPFIYELMLTGVQISRVWPICSTTKSKLGQCEAYTALIVGRKNVSSPHLDWPSEKQLFQSHQLIYSFLSNSGRYCLSPQELGIIISGVAFNSLFSHKPETKVKLLQDSPQDSPQDSTSLVGQSLKNWLVFNEYLLNTSKILNESFFDKETRFCCHWYFQSGFQFGRRAEADILARAKGTTLEKLRNTNCIREANTSEGKQISLKTIKSLTQDQSDQSQNQVDSLSIWGQLHFVLEKLDTQSDDQIELLLRKLPANRLVIHQLACELFYSEQTKNYQWYSEKLARLLQILNK